MKRLFFLYFFLTSISSYGAVSIDGIYYNFSGTNASVTAGFPRYTGNIVIPSTVSYSGITYTVTSIESAAFEESVSMSSVTIPTTVTKISAAAFRNCTSLGSISIPNSVNLIDNYAFTGCTALKSIILEDGAGEITFSNNTYAKDIFKDSPIESLYLGRNINYNLMYGSPFSAKTTLKNLTIGNQVSELFYMSFDGCSGLTGELIIPNSVTSIGGAAFRGCSNLNGTLTIPNSVKSIGSSSFENCSKITALILPDSVTSIGSSAFRNCSSLTSSLNLPNTISKIQDYTFEGCSKLTGTLFIPNNITSIGNNSFKDCSSITKLIIPNTTKTIGNYAFSNLAGLTDSLIIPNSVTSIGERAFQTNGAQKIVIGHGVTSISAFAFNGCSNLESLIIGNSLTSIKEYTFSNCTFLESVTIGKKVSQIDPKAFANCKYVRTINCKNLTPPPVVYYSGVNEGIDDINRSICTLYVPWQSTSKYKANEYWKGYYKVLETDFSSESDATLSNLSAIGCVLTPSFSPSVLNYTTTVSNDVKSVILNGTTSSATATITTANDSSKYTLNVGDNIISFVVMSEDGITSTYTVKITREASAASVTEESIMKFSLYPNPIQNNLFIKSDLPIDKVEIYSLNGNLIISEYNFNEKISVSELPNGIYLLYIYTEKKVITKKIIKD